MAESHRHQDDNGYLTVRSTPVSSYGIFDYSAGQLGLDGDPNRIVKVYRPESALIDPDAVASFQVVPLIDNHDLLSGFEDDDDAMAPEEKGIDGVMYAIKYVKPWLNADLKIFTRRMQRALDSGKVDLSLGYSCDFVLQSGTFNGQPYEAIQINLRGNHIALVDVARVEGARVLDSKLIFDCLSFNVVKSIKDVNMVQPVKGKNAAKKPQVARKVAMDNAVAQLRKLLPEVLPALEQFLSEEAAEPAHQEGGEAVVAEPTAVAEPAEHVQSEGDSHEELGAAVSQIKELLAKLEASMPAAEGEHEAPAEPAEDPEVGEDESGEGTAVAAEDEGGEEQAEDSIEGLEGNEQSHAIGADEASEDCFSGNNGKASSGPSAGVHSSKSTGDAALRKSIYEDMARKQRLYDRVSHLTGAFDHATMTSDDMAAYAVKKLKLSVPKGAKATFALDSFLTGVERATAEKKSVSTTVGDSAFGDFDPIDNYLKGAK